MKGDGNHEIHIKVIHGSTVTETAQWKLERKRYMHAKMVRDTLSSAAINMVKELRDHVKSSWWNQRAKVRKQQMFSMCKHVRVMYSLSTSIDQHSTTVMQTSMVITSMVQAVVLEMINNWWCKVQSKKKKENTNQGCIFKKKRHLVFQSSARWHSN